MSDTTLATINKPKRIPLKGLPATAFQHPLDRQATDKLKKLKGFDWLVGKFVEYGIERIEYVKHVGGGVRIGPNQMPKHYEMLRESCYILDTPEPEMYVMQGGVNAYTSGHNHPFIVLETGLLELMEDDDEVMAVIAHELGHIKCGHVLYKTMARGIKPLLEMVGKATLGVGHILGSGIEAALLAWNRRSELSSDRAALLVMQDSRPCISMLMKLAGGTERHVTSLNAEQFLLQARAYKEGMDEKMSDRFYRFMVNFSGDHPFAVERARSLDEWIGSAEYTAILSGQYMGNAIVKTEFCQNPDCSRIIPLEPNEMFCSTCGMPLRTH